MIRLVALVVLGLILYFGVRKCLRTPGAVNAMNLRNGLLLLVIPFLLLLAASGRLAPLLALAGAVFTFVLRLSPYLVRYLPLLHELWSRRAASAGPSARKADGSTVNTRFVRMHLDHATGEISGEVLEGAFAGKKLSQLSRDDLMELYAECTADSESARLVKTYLDRLYGDTWSHERRSTERGSNEGKMRPEEALDVLGLSPAASKREIIDAHRRLMQKFHPDRGGSDYLASKINQAKTVLLSS
jgi:hypothetical protein